MEIISAELFLVHVESFNIRHTFGLSKADAEEIERKMRERIALRAKRHRHKANPS